MTGISKPRNKTHDFKFYYPKEKFLIRELKYIVVIISCLSVTGKLFSQDLLMSQYFSAPLNLNPALAGISYGPRATLNYRNQWSALGDGFNGGFTTYMAGFDMHIDKIRAGVGASFTGDQIANGLFGQYELKLIYSQQVKFNKKMGMKIGISGSYLRTQVNWGKLLWADMIDSLSGFYHGVNVPNSTSQTPPGKTHNDQFEMGAGAVFFTEKFYVGIAANNLLMHRQSFYTNETPADVKFTVHLGANLPIKSVRGSRYNIWMSPNVLFLNQGKAFQAEATLLTGISVVYFGLGYRNVIYNSDAIIGYLGFKKGKFRIGYSYDFTMSKLNGLTGGTHELSFTFNWTGDDNSLNPKKSKAYVECPAILNF